MNLFELRQVESEGECVRVELVGLLTREGWPLEYDPFLADCRPGVFGAKVLADLSRVTFVDSSGMGWLAVSNARFRDAGGAIIFHSASPITRRLLELMHLDQVLTLAADEPAARRLAAEAIPA
jgi:ABC-type transporter Mla MlaB component